MRARHRIGKGELSITETTTTGPARAGWATVRGKVTARYGVLGAVMIVSAMFLIPGTTPEVNFATMFLGAILFFDALSYLSSGYSLAHSNRGRLATHLLLLALSLFVVEEVFLHWIAKSYFGPRWSLRLYLIAFAPVWCLWSLYLLEPYVAAKALLARYWPARRVRDTKGGLLDPRSFGVIGAVGSLAALVFLAANVRLEPELEMFFAINKAPTVSPWLYVAGILSFLCLGLLVDYFDYKRHGHSLVHQTINGNYLPVLAITLASSVAGIGFEVFNLYYKVYRYANIPFQEVTLLGIPVFILAGLPFQYFLVLPLYSLINPKERTHIY